MSAALKDEVDDFTKTLVEQKQRSSKMEKEKVDRRLRFDNYYSVEDGYPLGFNIYAHRPDKRGCEDEIMFVIAYKNNGFGRMMFDKLGKTSKYDIGHLESRGARGGNNGFFAKFSANKKFVESIMAELREQYGELLAKVDVEEFVSRNLIPNPVSPQSSVKVLDELDSILASYSEEADFEVLSPVEQQERMLSLVSKTKTKS